MYVWGKRSYFVTGVPKVFDITYDKDPATFSKMKIDGGPDSPTGLTRNTNVRVSFKVSDFFTKINNICIKFNDSSKPIAGDSCFIPVNLGTFGLPPAKQLDVVDYPYLIGFSPGIFYLYIWAQDEAGNITDLGNSGIGSSQLDMDTINYAPSGAPEVLKFHVANTSSSDYPASNAAMQFGANDDVFIQWNIRDDIGVAENGISLYVTYDDVNYTLIAENLANQSNSACTVNHETSIGNTELQYMTGCYRWKDRNGSTSYMAIRMFVKDLDGITSTITSAPLNIAKFRPLAGNVDPGTDGSAVASMFMYENRSERYGYPGSLLVAKNGTVYFRDKERGILQVHPSDGIQRVLIPTTGTQTGDGQTVKNLGGEFQASLKHPVKIALDPEDRVLVWDYDRIRIIDTTIGNPTIDTLISGGTAMTDPPSGTANVNPTKVYIQFPGNDADLSDYTSVDEVTAPFYVLPNGDIVFRSESYFTAPSSGGRIRYFKRGEYKVIGIVPSGNGSFVSKDISACKFRHVGLNYDITNAAVTGLFTLFEGEDTGDCQTSSYVSHSNIDPVTGISADTSHPPLINNDADFTRNSTRVFGRNGKMYAFSKEKGQLYKYVSTSGEWTLLAGTGTSGSCSDSTKATECDMDILDVYIAKDKDDGKDAVYILDRGLVRTINSGGKIVTMMGVSFSAGDTNPALVSRFNEIDRFLFFDTDSEVFTLDHEEKRFRSFVKTDDIRGIAGNGINTVPVLATSAHLTSTVTVGDTYGYGDFGFFYDNSKKNLVFPMGKEAVGKLTEGGGDTYSWGNFIGTIAGGSGTTYSAADGLSGTSIQLGGYMPRILGATTTEVLSIITKTDGTNSLMKIWAMADGTQTHYLGDNEEPVSTSGICSDGTANTACILPSSADATYTGASYLVDKWYFSLVGSDKIYYINGSDQLASYSIPSTEAGDNLIRGFAQRKIGVADANGEGNQDDIVIYYCATNGKLYRYNRTQAVKAELDLGVSGITCTGRNVAFDPDGTQPTLIFLYKRNGMLGMGEYLLP